MHRISQEVGGVNSYQRTFNSFLIILKLYYNFFIKIGGLNGSGKVGRGFICRPALEL
jgi:hypothetical protein